MLILKGELRNGVINFLSIALLTIFFTFMVTYIKYKPAYTVTLAGETLGYASGQEEIDNEINDYINTKEGTVALIDIDEMPEYEFKLVPRNEEINNEEIIEIVENTAKITYKTYGVTVNGEVKTEVESEDIALDIVSNLSQDVADGVDFELGITEIYSEEDSSVDSEVALSTVEGIKDDKVKEYEEEQARIAAEKTRNARKRERNSNNNNYTLASSTSSTSSGSYGVINGIAVSKPLRTSALITSRFGEVSSSRSSSHTGLDLATSIGTPIYSIASGTVVSASYQGSYGNFIIIDHGNGVQSCYGHCNSIYVNVGQSVTQDTVIGTVGSTGNSTGPHLHLEIRINGVAYNPQNYLY